MSYYVCNAWNVAQSQWTTTGTATNSTWQYWTTGTAAGNTITVNSIWANWNANATATTPIYAYVGTNSAQPLAETEEAKAARLERERVVREEWQAAQAKAAQERREADARAELILSQSLDEQQAKDYAEKGHFDVRVLSAEGERRYRVEKGWSGNVQLLDAEGKRRRRYCIHPREEVPFADNLLAQKLLLEADEETFLRLANAS